MLKGDWGTALGGLSMKTISSALMSAALLSALACLTPASAMEAHTVLTPGDVKWGPGPASVPKGAQASAIYGDPSKDGLFALRLKLPKGYHIPPHTHPRPELVTVLSGTLRLGEGATADQAKTKPLPAGSFFSVSPGMQDHVYAREGAGVPPNTTRPRGPAHRNEKEDPRKTQ